jgi:excisionase family DNA binding protein
MTDSNGQGAPYLTVAELAEKLGVSSRTVQRWLADTDIPHRRAGNIVRFRLAEVDEWMRGRAEKSTAEGAA